MISRSCLQPRQCSPDAVLADHFLPGPSLRRGEEGPPLSAPLSKQKKPRPRVSCLEPVQCESLVIRLGNIHYISFLLQKLLWKYIFFGSVIENLLNQIDRDLLWLCWPSLGWLPRPGCRAQAAAVKQSQAVSCPGPGVGSCLACAACVKLSEVLGLTEHQAVESVHPRISEIQTYYCEAGSGLQHSDGRKNICRKLLQHQSASRGWRWPGPVYSRELLHSQISKWEPSSFIMSPPGLAWARLGSLLLYCPGPCLLSLRHPRPSPGPG